MDGDDVAGFEKGVKVGVGDVIMVMGAVIAYDSGAEGFGQLGGAVSDGAGADDAYCAVFDFNAPKTGACFSMMGGIGSFCQFPVERKNHAHGQFCHGLRRVAGAVGDGDMFLSAGFNVHMVHAGEGDAEVFEGACFIQGLFFKG